MGDWRIGHNNLTVGVDLRLGDSALRLYAQENFIRWAASNGKHHVRLISPTLSGHFLYRGVGVTSPLTEGERGDAINAAQAEENAAAEQNEETMPIDVAALQNPSVEKSGGTVDNRWAAFLGLQVAEYQYRYNKYLSSRIGANIGLGLFRQIRAASTATVQGENPIVTNRCDSGPFSDAPGNGCETITLAPVSYPDLPLNGASSQYAFGFQVDSSLDLLVWQPAPDSLPGLAVKLSLTLFNHEQTLSGYEASRTDNIYSRFAETPERPPIALGLEYRFGAEKKPARTSGPPSTTPAPVSTTPTGGTAKATAKIGLGGGSAKRTGTTPPGGITPTKGAPHPAVTALEARRSSWATVRGK
ncbi:MAG: hypothetical protein HYT77_00990 [Deltaproteobacteria bacterium]|nr:hypothetical protein [Deltaproteobacteria bacterium]